MSLQEQRSRFDTSGARLRRARRLFAFIVRPWVERARDPAVYRERAWRCARRGMDAGLWKSKQERDGVFGLLGQWRREDRANWWAWRNSDQRRGVALMRAREFYWWREERKKKKA